MPVIGTERSVQQVSDELPQELPLSDGLGPFDQRRFDQLAGGSIRPGLMRVPARQTGFGGLPLDVCHRRFAHPRIL